MNTKYKDNWEETKERFVAWWNRSSTGRPLMRIVAKREKLLEELEEEKPFSSADDFHMDVAENIKRFRNFNRKYKMMAEAFPHFSINIGPGSMATYLGSKPEFTWDTVWYEDIARDGWDKIGRLRFDPGNYWWKRHINALKMARELSNEEFMVDIPDIIEGIDILSALRGPQQLCYDLMDMPEVVKDYIDQLDELYFKYYDPIYDIVKLIDGSSSYTAFDVWGPGKTAKVQCDFCVMMSPDHFREFVQPSLKKQCQQLDNSIFHLDGPGAIKHVDALMEIEELDALQWTPGAGQPDGGYEGWYCIYDKVKAAGKSLWIYISDGGPKDWVESATRIVRRYGADRLYLLFPAMNEADAKELLEIAERNWK
ncbi:MAG: trimethylamine corrinoid protein 2 [Clostridiaceae bacterium]|nr:trimethylamine corrinoid protein 2 [Clostridiaceae bacterium]